MGLEQPLARRAATTAVAKELRRGSTSDQISRLNELVGTRNLGTGRLKDALIRNTPGEMDKAIHKFQKQGKEISIDTLCAEVKSEPGFLKMCEKVGITYDWFTALAKERMEANGL